VRLAIIGSGPGGYVAAVRAAQLGAQVTIIEKYEVGGTCLNWGCIPTKALIASAEAINKARRLAEYGIVWSGEASPDILRIIERKDRIVSTQVKGIRSIFKFRGIRLVEGQGKLIAKDNIEIAKRDGTSERLEADKVIIATGSSPAALPMLPFDGETILSSDDALRLKALPGSLIIIGAGAIGCEFAYIFSEFGVDVTIVELLDRAVATEDHEISEILEREFKKKRIRLITGVAVERVDKRSGAHVFLNNGKELTADKLLVSVGRSFNTGDLGLEGIGIEKGAKGEIRVDNRLETNVRGVFAIGDVVGGMMLAHVASMEGVVAASNACGVDAAMDYSAVPAAIFTSPEIGSVGLREFQAKDRGLNIKIGRFQFRSLAKAHTMGDIAGIIKIVADADTGKVLGVHIIGPNASELVHEGALAIKAGLRAQEVAGMVHAHPTLSEGIMEAMADVNGDSIHAVRQ
jgi:dihydrolipoamide dehydrogenase